MTRVFVADDHAIVRHGLRELLETTGEFTVVGEADNGRAVLEALSKTACDVLILDLSLPRVSGTEVLHQLGGRPDAPRILVLSMYSEDQYALRAVQAGAAGYVSKSHPPATLLQAVRQVAAGQKYLSPAVTATAEAADAPAPHTTLTAREYQVFLLFLQGRTGAEIAAELNIAASTVSNFVSRIKAKLGAHTVADIVAYAHRMKLVD